MVKPLEPIFRNFGKVVNIQLIIYSRYPQSGMSFGERKCIYWNMQFYICLNAWSKQFYKNQFIHVFCFNPIGPNNLKNGTIVSKLQ